MLDVVSLTEELVAIPSISGDEAEVVHLNFNTNEYQLTRSRN